MRCDVNVSVRPRGQKEFGTKVEIKNMNTFGGMQKAIDYEIDRQVGIRPLMSDSNGPCHSFLSFKLLHWMVQSHELHVLFICIQALRDELNLTTSEPLPLLLQLQTKLGGGEGLVASYQALPTNAEPL